MSAENNIVDPEEGLTCSACRLVFATSALQREHYQTEWHHYNLKRQITGLSPISINVFENKILTLEGTVAIDGRKVEERDIDYCVECGKRFKSQNTFENHLNSKKHKENVQKFERERSKTAITSFAETIKLNKKYKSESEDDEAASWKSVDSNDGMAFDETLALPSTSCLFCNYKSDTVESNLEHMTFHGFYIPDAEYCINANELLTYLGMKVGCGDICILCNKRFRTLDAVQKHMRDKQHCRFSINNEKIVEYLDFYDYNSLLPDQQEGDEDDNIAVHEGYTLVLPSGARLGHRALDRYYKQHLSLQKDFESNPSDIHQNSETMNQALEKLGWTGTTGEIAVMKARDISFMKRITSKHLMQQGLKANRLFKTEGRSFYWCM